MFVIEYMKGSWVWWHMPVMPALKKVEAGKLKGQPELQSKILSQKIKIKNCDE